MSNNSLAFALEQKQLLPVQQLVLIVVADCCGEQFKFNEASKVVLNHTSLSPLEANETLRFLYENMYITDTSNGSGVYYVVVPDEQ